MNIYLHELRAFSKNTLIWIVTLGALTLFFFTLFPAFSKSADLIINMFKQFPDGVRAAFGFPIELFGTVLGFYSFLIMCVTVSGAVQGTYLGISVLAKETTGKTADFLLTKPVTRVRVITAKILAAFTCITVTSIAYFVVAFLTLSAYKTADFNLNTFVLMTLSFYGIQIIFLAIGLFMAALVPKIKSVVPVALSTAFSFFVIGMIGAVLKEEKIYYFSPFKYFDTAYIIEHSSYQLSYLVVGIAVVALAVAATYAIYTRRDIHAV